MGVRTGNASKRWMWIFVLIIVGLGFPPRASAQNLTNADVVKMVQAKLSDALIISEIKHSTCNFDTSPAALIKLKQAGVSDQVLQAMTEARHQGKVQASGIRSSSPLPTAFGFYVVDGQELRELEFVNVTTRIGLIAGATIGGNAGYAVDGLAGEPPIVIHDLTPTILVYQQDFNMSTLHLSKLAYVNTMQAYQFNMLGTQPAFFRNVYGRGYHDTVQIDLWRPDGQVPIRIEPVEGRSGMYRLIPSTALQSGRYSLYETGAVHGANIIFASLRGRSSQAFYFGVESSGSSPTYPSAPMQTPPPVATAGCSDFGACMHAGGMAMGSRRWAQALVDFKKASKMDAAKPGAWLAQGMAHLSLGQGTAVPPVWDNALARGGAVRLRVWHYAGFHTPRGVFLLDTKTVAFADSKGRTIFSVPPSQVSALESHHPPLGGQAWSFGMKVQGHRYWFSFVPIGIQCRSPITCNKSAGYAQEGVVSNYVVQTIPKLASGALTVSAPPPPSQPSAPTSAASVADMASSGHIPPPIRAILDSQYPGWKPVATSAEYLKTCKPPNPGFKYWFVHGDFNGDGQRDYAAEVVQGTTGYLIAFLAGDGGYQPVVAQTFPGARLTWPVLGVAPKGANLPDLKSASNGGFVINHRIIPTDALLGFACGKSGEAYLYSSSKFESFFTSD